MNHLFVLKENSPAAWQNLASHFLTFWENQRKVLKKLLSILRIIEQFIWVFLLQCAWKLILILIIHKKFEECTFKNKLIGFFPYYWLTRFCHSLISKVLPITDIDITWFFHSINESFGIFYSEIFHNNLTLALFTLFNSLFPNSIAQQIIHMKTRLDMVKQN